jgi:hypothetical protein
MPGEAGHSGVDEHTARDLAVVVLAAEWLISGAFSMIITDSFPW